MNLNYELHSVLVNRMFIIWPLPANKKKTSAVLQNSRMGYYTSSYHWTQTYQYMTEQNNIIQVYLCQIQYISSTSLTNKLYSPTGVCFVLRHSNTCHWGDCPFNPLNGGFLFHFASRKADSSSIQPTSDGFLIPSTHWKTDSFSLPPTERQILLPFHLLNDRFCFQSTC